jgi:hypothetical protein
MQATSTTRLTQYLLAAIVCLLAWIAVRPSVATVHAASAPPPQFSAGPIAVQYKVASVSGTPAEVQSKLTGLGNDGWSLVQCTGLYSECIFRK